MTRRILFAFIAIILTFLFLEGIARLAESFVTRKKPVSASQAGWQTEFFKSVLDWHEADPNLLWRFKAGLDNPLIRTNSDHLLGPEIVKPKPPKTFRILLLGDSSPVGLGLKSRGQAFGELLKYMLQLDFSGNINLDLVNAAVSGYSSVQVALFLKLKGWNYQPDLVLVYCGNNDASLSGVYSDKELLESQRLKGVRSTLSHLALYRMMRNLFVPERPGGKTAGGDLSDLKVRVDSEEYGRNLRFLYDECRSHDCPLIILKPPVPLLWPAGLQFKLFTQSTGEDGRLIMPEELTSVLGRKLKYCLDEKRFQDIYGPGDIFTRSVYQSAYSDSMTPDRAIEYYKNLLKARPDDPVLLNNLGVSYWQKSAVDMGADYFLLAEREFIKQYPARNPGTLSALSPFIYNNGIAFLDGLSKQAALYTGMRSLGFGILDTALQYDYLSLRIKRSYYEEIDKLKGQPGLTIIDLPSVFNANGGERLFIDHCHPTPEGHRLIAQTLRDAVIYNQYIH